jgi:hypothetical protein
LGLRVEYDVVMIPWIGNREDAIPQGGFASFLTRLLTDTRFDPLP